MKPEINIALLNIAAVKQGHPTATVTERVGHLGQSVTVFPLAQHSQMVCLSPMPYRLVT